MPILRCRDVLFNSQLDETMFFTSLKSISSIKKIEGRGRDLFLSLPSRIPNRALRELLGVFHRYKKNMRQLAVFANATNRVWFQDRKNYWFKRVFPAKKKNA